MNNKLHKNVFSIVIMLSSLNINNFVLNAMVPTIYRKILATRLSSSQPKSWTKLSETMMPANHHKANQLSSSQPKSWTKLSETEQAAIIYNWLKPNCKLLGFAGKNGKTTLGYYSKNSEKYYLLYYNPIAKELISAEGLSDPALKNYTDLQSVPLLTLGGYAYIPCSSWVAEEAIYLPGKPACYAKLCLVSADSVVQIKKE